jgi:hypothetical protein
VVRFTPQPLYYRGKNTRYPLERRLVGPQSRSERCGEYKNSQPPPVIEPRSFSPKPVAVPTELPRLLHTYTLAENIKGSHHLGHCGGNRSIILKWMLEKQCVGSSEHGNESSGSTKGE